MRFKTKFTGNDKPIAIPVAFEVVKGLDVKVGNKLLKCFDTNGPLEVVEVKQVTDLSDCGEGNGMKELITTSGLIMYSYETSVYVKIK